MELKSQNSDTNNSDILVIPMQIESANKILRQHWAVRRRSKQEFALFIRNQMNLKKIKRAECKKYKIKIISYRARKLDYDNLVLGCKGLLDAMIDENLIWDDSPDYVDVTYEQNTQQSKLSKNYDKKVTKYLKKLTVIVRENL